jgi:hypothetical protein
VNPWENESGLLTELAKQLIENRTTVSADALIGAWRELDAVARLLWVAIFCEGRMRSVRRVAAACVINYGQTPINQYGYIPPAATSIKLSCILAEDEGKAAKLSNQPIPKPERQDVVAVDLADFD